MIQEKIRVLGEAGLSEAKFSEMAEAKDYYFPKVTFVWKATFVVLSNNLNPGGHFFLSCEGP